MSAARPCVMILGAGINGCALARELALNDVAVWLVDTADIASGASAGSSHLIHGGLRYLEYGEFDLVKESLGERTRLLRLAPQFVRPLRLWIPTSNRFGGAIGAVGRFFHWDWWPTPQPRSGRGLELIRAGLAMYDAYARDPSVPKYRVTGLNAPDAPPFDRHRYRRLAAYYDAQVEFPERLTLALLEDAREISAAKGLDFRVLTHHTATLHDKTVEIVPSSAGATSEAPTVQPAAIVNATGAWVDETLARLHVDSKRLMGGTKGSHLFTFNQRLRDALRGQGIYAEARDGRPIFITPLAGTVLIGTTDVRVSGPPENALATDAELDYLIESVNAMLPEARLTRADINFHYSAVRPLPYADAKTTGAITRRHALAEHPGASMPLISVVGGKLTTMRSLAALTAATVLSRLGQPILATSEERPIPGAAHLPTDARKRREFWQRLASELSLSAESVAEVGQLVGSRAEEILRSDSDRTLLTDSPLPCAMVRWSIEHEWAHTLADLVERRLMLLYHQRLTRGCLNHIAKLLVTAGHLPADQLEATVAAQIERLAVRYGKQVE